MLLKFHLTLKYYDGSTIEDTFSIKKDKKIKDLISTINQAYFENLRNLKIKYKNNFIEKELDNKVLKEIFVEKEINELEIEEIEEKTGDKEEMINKTIFEENNFEIEKNFEFYIMEVTEKMRENIKELKENEFFIEFEKNEIIYEISKQIKLFQKNINEKIENFEKNVIDSFSNKVMIKEFCNFSKNIQKIYENCTFIIDNPNETIKKIIDLYNETTCNFKDNFVLKNIFKKNYEKIKELKQSFYENTLKILENEVDCWFIYYDFKELLPFNSNTDEINQKFFIKSIVESNTIYDEKTENYLQNNEILKENFEEISNEKFDEISKEKFDEISKEKFEENENYKNEKKNEFEKNIPNYEMNIKNDEKEENVSLKFVKINPNDEKQININEKEENVFLFKKSIKQENNKYLKNNFEETNENELISINFFEKLNNEYKNLKQNISNEINIINKILNNNFLNVTIPSIHEIENEINEIENIKNIKINFEKKFKEIEKNFKYVQNVKKLIEKEINMKNEVFNKNKNNLVEEINIYSENNYYEEIEEIKNEELEYNTNNFANDFENKFNEDKGNILKIQHFEKLQKNIDEIKLEISKNIADCFKNCEKNLISMKETMKNELLYIKLPSIETIEKIINSFLGEKQNWNKDLKELKNLHLNLTKKYQHLEKYNFCFNEKILKFKKNLEITKVITNKIMSLFIYDLIQEKKDIKELLKILDDHNIYFNQRKQYSRDKQIVKTIVEKLNNEEKIFAEKLEKYDEKTIENYWNFSKNLFDTMKKINRDISLEVYNNQIKIQLLEIDKKVKENYEMNLELSEFNRSLLEKIQKDNEKQFKFEWLRKGNDVRITGNWINWDEKGIELEGPEENKEKIVFIPKQKYYFKFIVDGEWTLRDDLLNEIDEKGIRNNFFII